MIGTIAGILTTLAFVPQVIKVVKTKDTAALSLGMYSIQVLGITLWLIYGLSISDFALISANAVTLCLSLTILGYKLRYR
ncbi:SemiSWEET family sugar transporter [Ligilactobacillus agilis]|uniref:SemiSWEET transporter n=1 Tax=Ligilactobacillus agilis TaxID=1601 RepID=UPI00191DA8D6|nr:SemiSWEET transporter [Ligilactobacillus agilis]MBL1055107.1 SemiSWEET family sugar transporter [Ligilactobacillus agilis]